MSGGQRQRVALARALVMRPKVLLLDEPLGALDLKLRHQMQIELKHIQQEVGITFIYVTHDQEEALTMSDRLAVFNRGGIEQWAHPPRCTNGRRRASWPDSWGSPTCSPTTWRGDRRRSAAFTIRPEKIAMVDLDANVEKGIARATGHVQEVVYLGAVTRYIVELESEEVAGRDGAEPQRRARWKLCR